MRASLGKGDWLIGITGQDLQGRIKRPVSERRILYVMKIDKRRDLDTYYHEYPKKRPKPSGTPIEMAGDAFYRLQNGSLEHIETDNHNWREVIIQDVKGDLVFISKTFWYFGNNCRQFPEEKWAETLFNTFQKSALGLRYVRGGSGLQWNEDDIVQFLTWLPSTRGILGNPIDMDNGDSPSVCSSSCGQK